MINEFDYKYPSEDIHEVKLSEKELDEYLKTLEKHYNTLNSEGFKVPKVEYHPKTDEHGPYITFEKIEGCLPLSEQLKDLPKGTEGKILARGKKLAQDIASKHDNMIIYNRNSRNVFYNKEKDEVWLYDIRQTTWDNVKKWYFKVNKKKQKSDDID